MKWFKNNIWIIAMAICPAFLFAQAKETPKLSRADWGAMETTVSVSNGQWLIKGKKQEVSLNAGNLALAVKAGPASWTMVPSAADDMTVKAEGKMQKVRLADARDKKVIPYDAGYKTGVQLILKGWPGLDLTLYLTVCLEGDQEDLVFDLAAEEHAVTVRELNWPTALDAGEIDHTLLSNVRGVLLPRNWPKPYHPIRTSDADGSISKSDRSELQSNVIEDWCMSWWGFQKGKSAMMVIVETPDDAAYQFNHPAGGPTVIGPRWRPQLGKLGYPRAARMCFFNEGNYVDMAKRYRSYVINTGLFVSLKDKIARKPIVAELIGTPIIRSGILTNYKPESARWKRDSTTRYKLVSFDQRAEEFRRYKAMGVDKLCVVLTGWPNLGYDRQHPDAMPPAPTAGGWEGMKRLAETCKELGYLFSLHDQYRDYYLDAPSYNTKFAIHAEEAGGRANMFPGTRFGDSKEGRIPFMDYWDGGKMAYLSGRFMLGHLNKNYQWMFKRDIRPQGNYLDVFGYVPPDEDFNPEHPSTRTDGLNDRIKCYNWSRNNLGFVGTETACDWTIPYVDFSSPLKSKNGISLPLWELVYHDAILTPYHPDDLHGLLYGGTPQVSFNKGIDASTVKLINRMRELSKRVALLEMTKHEFLDKNYRQERSTFSDGTTVTVDWDKNTVAVSPELKIK
ncbi:hypothetical protein ABIE26_001935 [Pedobacter africanus]|uniref:Uncharacterized protein n=1 Tax=Pedobacter africanus TaxID=151894 RepID=A0ACC6KQV8_9SPHI|nr:DUF5696 domain-containing protein [Pedobacter africanus]MDR6781577.1 hypothetical protein [Pedobacter africanus]